MCDALQRSHHWRSQPLELQSELQLPPSCNVSAVKCWRILQVGMGKKKRATYGRCILCNWSSGYTHRGNEPAAQTMKREQPLSSARIASHLHDIYAPALQVRVLPLLAKNAAMLGKSNPADTGYRTLSGRTTPSLMSLATQSRKR